MPTYEQVIEALQPVEDPELHRSIVDLGMVRNVAIDAGNVGVLVALTVAGCPLRAEITNRVEGAVRALAGVSSVSLDFTVMTDDERAELRERLHGDAAATAGSQPAHGHAQGRAIPFADPESQHPVPAHRVGQGRRGQVVRHHEPRRRARAAGPLGRHARRRRLRLLDPPDARHRPRPRRARPDAACRPRHGACAASRWATSPRRISRSSGAAPCSTRRSSSSSPTSTGTNPTSCCSTCPRAPATSRSRCRSTCRGLRSTS